MWKTTLDGVGKPSSGAGAGAEAGALLLDGGRAAETGAAAAKRSLNDPAARDRDTTADDDADATDDADAIPLRPPSVVVVAAAAATASADARKMAVRDAPS
jgi:hypothetical protein